MALQSHVKFWQAVDRLQAHARISFCVRLHGSRAPTIPRIGSDYLTIEIARRTASERIGLMDRNDTDWRWLRRSQGLFLLFLALLPIFLYALVNARLGAAEVYKWLPQSNADKATYTKFLNHFGNDQVMMVCWEGMSLDDPRTAEFVKRIENHAIDSSRTKPDLSLFDRVETTASLFDTLKQPPLNFSDSTIKERFEGSLIGPSGECAVWVYFQDSALADPKLAVNELLAVAKQVPGLESNRIRLVGSLYEAFCIDRSVEEALLRFVPLSSIAAILASWFLLRSLLDATIALLLAGIGQLVPVAVIVYAGDRFSAVLTMLPTLVFVLTLSSVIHLIKYAKHAGAPERALVGVSAVRMGIRPCLWASGTTILAMLTLSYSELTPIRNFGFYSALSLGLATFWTLGLFPAIYEFLSRFRRVTPSEIEISNESITRHPWATRFVDCLTPHRNLVLAGTVTIILLSGSGIQRLQVGTTFSTMYPEDHPFIEDVRWIEEKIGNITPVEVVLTTDNESPTTLIQKLVDLDKLCQEFQQLPDVGAVSSIVDYLPEIPKASSVGATARRAIMNRKITQAFESMVNNQGGESNEPVSRNSMVYVDSESTEFRILIRVTAFTERFGTVLQGIREVINDFENEHRSGTAYSKLEITGVMQLAHASQEIMGNDFLYGMAGALALLTGFMIFHAKSVWIGLVYMLPNILPVALTLGGMAWLRQPIDMGGVLCSTIALGISVDDTLHLTNYYQHRKAQGDNSRNAMIRSVAACGPAMAITTATTCFSFAPFLLASFAPIQQFAWVCMTMLVLAWIGDILVLSPLLAGLRRSSCDTDSDFRDLSTARE